MSDAYALAFILDDARRREVPCVISRDGRADAFAMPPDYELVQPREDLSAAEMLAALLGTEGEKPG